MKVYIGEELACTPLGTSAMENFAAITSNKSGISEQGDAGYHGENLWLATISSSGRKTEFFTLLSHTFQTLQWKLPGITQHARTLLVLSTTKGDFSFGMEEAIVAVLSMLKKILGLRNDPVAVSNACISGVQAINYAGMLVRNKKYDHVIVIGCDVITDFVVYGFQSLFAISNMPCAPFDKNRNGISLGEAMAMVILSNDDSIFTESPLQYLAGASSNDANHITGPSRTGEGLFQCIDRLIRQPQVAGRSIDFISAHGTATPYNDEMEALAIDRAGLNEVPVNSFKGYFGHTLGAAGVLETVMCLQSIRNNQLAGTCHLKVPGVSKNINLFNETKKAKVNTILKTASGFGGSNAALMIGVE